VAKPGLDVLSAVVADLEQLGQTNPVRVRVMFRDVLACPTLQ
jgi:hypothetical protein